MHRIEIAEWSNRCRLAAGLLGALVLTACHTAGLVKPPTSRVVAAEVTQATDEGARVEVTVQVTNPNDVVLPAAAARLELEIEGVGRYEFTDTTAKDLPPRGTQTLTLPAAFAGDGPNISGKAYSVTGFVRYEPPGEIRRLLTDAGLPLPRSDFDATGRLE